jgi:peptidyl-prolyl cis-trans isomerase D
MLQKIREVVTGWLAIVIVALLCIPFAFWGINYYFGQGTEPVVVKVNDKEIKLTQFQRAFSNYRLQMRALLGDKQGTIEDDFIKQQTIEKLVESEILNQATRSANLRISDDHIVGVIKGIDVFQTEDGFNRSFYELGVQRLGMPPAVYEAQLRLDMASEQLQSAIVESSFVLKEEAKIIANLEKQERDFFYGILAVDEVKDSIEVSDKEIEQYYKENKQNYQELEQVKIAYLDLSLDKLAEEVDVNDEMLLEYYTENKAKYDVPEQRKFNQALIKTSAKATEGEIEEARAKAEEIKKLIDSDKTFKEIAEEHSDDPGPQLQVSEYGFTQKGVMPAEIDKILFQMQTGEISEMIKTKEGFHFIEAIDAKGEDTNTFDNAKEQIEKVIQYQQAETRFFDLSDQMATLAYEHSDTLDIAAEAIDIDVQESELFSRVGEKEGLLADPKIVLASFSTEVMGTGQNSEVLELSDNHLVVLRVTEHIPSTVKPIESVHDEIINDIRFLQAGEKQRELGRSILAQLREGKTLEELRTDHPVDWKYTEAITRTDVSVKRAILRAVFNLNKPQDDKPVYGGVTLGTGDYVVIALTKSADPETIFEKDIEDKQQQLQRARAGTDWNDFLETLRGRADIHVFADKI